MVTQKDQMVKTSSFFLQRWLCRQLFKKALEWTYEGHSKSLNLLHYFTNVHKLLLLLIPFL